MNGNIWDLKSWDRITLDSDVVAPTEDGEWIRVKYMDAPESPEIIGTEDLCSTDERSYLTPPRVIRSAIREHRATEASWSDAMDGPPD